MGKDQGFTLTELLVVISIIGILAGIILVGGGSARRDARDKRRKADIEHIAGLLQVRAAQVKLTNAALWRPTYWGQNNGTGFAGAETDVSWDGIFLPVLVTEGYTTAVPLDPLHPDATSNFYEYAYFSSPVWSCNPPFFAVRARLEGTVSSPHPCFPNTSRYTLTGN